jgi:hypothetical protein
MFLLRPDDETNGVYLYCLGLALERFGMRLVYAVAMSNHHHVVLFDPDGAWSSSSSICTIWSREP